MPHRPMMLLLALGVLVAAPAAAWAQTLPLVDAGKLTWGSATFPPFESMADGKAVGFDIDLMAAITHETKLQSAMTGMEFKGLIPAILGRRIDAMSATCTSIPTARRCRDASSSANLGHVVSMPYDLETIVDLLVPEPQRRGRFRRDYRGTTLFENLFDD